MSQFTCRLCGKLHDLSDVAFGADSPAQWHLLSEAEKAASDLTEDQCVIRSSEGSHYFVRACLDIPIRGTNTTFQWGVWVSLSEKSYAEMADHWSDPDRMRLGPNFGWLCTSIPGYPDTMFLKTRVHQRPVGLRPTLELEPGDHPLAVHQREGMPPRALEEIVAKLLHDPTAQCWGPAESSGGSAD